MAKDIIIGVVDRYNWDQIKYWSNSIDKSGFTGHKALIVYNMDAETVRTLSARDFMLIGCNQYDEQNGFSHDNSKGNVMVDRFFHISSFLSMLDQPMDIDRVIVTDVRDVVFQSNPTDWLNNYLFPESEILVGSENMTYGDEPWGRNNIKLAFGEYFLDNKRQDEIFCAGVIAGKREAIKDLFLNVWLVCRGLNPQVPGGGGPDQAALNILLDMFAYKSSTMFTNPSSGWVVHAGTSLPAIQAGSGGIGEEYVRNPNMSLPFVRSIEYSLNNETGIVYADNVAPAIIHQWDRVPDWKKLFEEKYG
jgi:hypothetical protein